MPIEQNDYLFSFLSILLFATNLRQYKQNFGHFVENLDHIL